MSDENENSTLTFANRAAPLLNALAALVVIVSALGGAAVYLSGVLDGYVDSLTPVPAGSIVAFDATECPAGWSPYHAAAGRVVVGVGSHTENDPWGNRVVELALRDMGGNRTHKLTVNEMPEHQHDLVNQPVSFVDVDGGKHANTGHGRETSRTGLRGGSMPHNNMPPYIALRHCRKDN